MLNEEQQLLRDTARDFFTNKAPVTQLRRLRDEGVPGNHDPDTWREMAQLGWAAIPFAEKYGGLEFGYTSLALVTEETGRTLAASPLFASIWLSGTLVSLACSETQCCALLPSICSGELLLATAVDESPHHDPRQVETSAIRTGSTWRLRGRKTFVIDGGIAHRIIVVARIDGTVAEDSGLGLFLVPADAPGLTIEPLQTVDSRNVANLALDDVTLQETALCGTGRLDPQIHALGLDIARVGLAAEMLGSAQACFDMTLGYLKERRQFDQPIGAFQALKHRMANLYCELELARSTVYEASQAIDEQLPGTTIGKLASLAKARLGDTLRQVTRESLQLHGGIGMTDEYDIGLYLKRAAVTEQLFGNVAFHTERYATLSGY